MIKAMESSGGEIFSVCEEARDSIYIVAGNYRKQGDDTETLNSGWCGEPIKHNRIVNGISSVPNPCISLLWMVQNDVIDSIVAKNKGSFIGRFGERAQRTAYKLLDHNLITAVASDAHSPVQRTTCMSDAYEYLSKSYPKDYLEALFTDNPRYICNGLRPIQFQRIPFKRTHR